MKALYISTNVSFWYHLGLIQIEQHYWNNNYTLLMPPQRLYPEINFLKVSLTVWFLMQPVKVYWLLSSQSFLCWTLNLLFPLKQWYSTSPLLPLVYVRAMIRFLMERTRLSDKCIPVSRVFWVNEFLSKCPLNKKISLLQ